MTSSASNTLPSPDLHPESPTSSPHPPLRSAHTWRFFTAGGFDQVRLDTAADLLHLEQLDQKLWVALSCPTQGLEFSDRTLNFLDTDRDGYIRPPELIAALHWVAEQVTDPEWLIRYPVQALQRLPLSALKTSHPHGLQRFTTARQLLAEAGKPEQDFITLEDVTLAQPDKAPANGDGVVTMASTQANMDAARTVMSTALALYPGVQDRSGDAGIDQALLERIKQEVSERQTWLHWGQELSQRQERKAVEGGLFISGQETEALFALYQTLQPKIDDFFIRCALGRFDERLSDWKPGFDELLKQLTPQQMGQDNTGLLSLPLAQPAPLADLPLERGINPAWQATLESFRQRLVAPLLGDRACLSEMDWQQLKEKLSSFQEWQAAEPGGPLQGMSAEELKSRLPEQGFEQVAKLIEIDLAAEPQRADHEDLEKLLVYLRDLHRLACNFVNFREFYAPSDAHEKALFQAGTLYLDGRSSDLCLKVLDPARHASLAALAGIYLVYCDCQRKGEGQTLSIAAAITAGDSSQILPGRNGVFYDRQGRDWQATVTRIVDHPISLKQAFFSPYRKASRLIAEQVQKFAAARAKAADDMVGGATTQTAHQVTTVPASKTPPEKDAPAKPPFDAGKFAGIFAAFGLAVGALGTAAASIISGFLGLKAWQIPLALFGFTLLVSGPSMLIAWFRLRSRHLGPLLDANGWAINTRAKINLPFGSRLTQTARLPAGSIKSVGDPYAEKPLRWKSWGLLILVMAGLLVWLWKQNIWMRF